MAGHTFAGIPLVFVGHNDDIAWGVTTTTMDFSDVYVEQLVTDDDGEPTGVLFRGEEVDFIRKPFTVQYNDGSSEERELLFVPHHGPVRGIDVKEGVALTLRWTGQDVDTDLDGYGGLATATTVEEARQSLELITSAGQNFVLIDRNGDIGWFPRGYLASQAVEEAAFSLEVGAVSPVIQSEAGFHILTVLETQADRLLSPDALLALKTRALNTWLAERRQQSEITVNVN